MEEFPTLDHNEFRSRLQRILLISNVALFPIPYIFLIILMEFNNFSRLQFTLLFLLAVIAVDSILVLVYFILNRPITEFAEEWETTGGDMPEERLKHFWDKLTRLPFKIGLTICLFIMATMVVITVRIYLKGMVDLRQLLLSPFTASSIGLIVGTASYFATKSTLNVALLRIASVKPMPWSGIRLNFTKKILILLVSVVIIPLITLTLLVERWTNVTIRQFYIDGVKADLVENARFLKEYRLPGEPLPEFMTDAGYYFLNESETLKEEMRRKRLGWEEMLPRYMTVSFEGDLLLAKKIDPGEYRPYRKKIRNVVIFFFFLISAFAVPAFYFFSKAMTRPVLNMTELTHQIAEGQAFRSQHLISYSDDETGELSLAFNELLFVVQKQFSTMESLINRIREAVQILGSSTSEMQTIIDGQAEGAQTQAGRVVDIAGTSNQIAASALQITEKSTSVKEFAEGTLNACVEGIKRIEAAVERIGDANRSSEMMIERMKRLEDQFKKIEDVVNSIAEVSERTQLLSLNASLEAVGAKKYGKRFGVVANEVERLATTIGQMTKQIYTQIDALRKAMDETSDASDENARMIEAGVKGVQKVKDDLDLLGKTAEKTYTAAIEINVSTRQQTDAMEKMTDTLDEIRELAQKVAGGSANSKNAIEEINRLAIGFDEMLSESQS